MAQQSVQITDKPKAAIPAATTAAATSTPAPGTPAGARQIVGPGEIVTIQPATIRAGLPTVTAQAKYTGSTDVQQKSIKLSGTGEYVNRSDYDSLSESQRAYLQKYGIEAFNAEGNKIKAVAETAEKEAQAYVERETAKQVKFEQENLVKLNTGETVFKDMFNTLSTVQQTKLRELGVEGYNKWTQEETVRVQQEAVQTAQKAKEVVDTIAKTKGIGLSDAEALLRAGVDATTLVNAGINFNDINNAAIKINAEVQKLGDIQAAVKSSAAKFVQADGSIDLVSALSSKAVTADLLKAARYDSNYIDALTTLIDKGYVKQGADGAYTVDMYKALATDTGNNKTLLKSAGYTDTQIQSASSKLGTIPSVSSGLSNITEYLNSKTGTVAGANQKPWLDTDRPAWQAYRASGGKLTPDQWAISGRPTSTAVTVPTQYSALTTEEDFALGEAIRAAGIQFSTGSAVAEWRILTSEQRQKVADIYGDKILAYLPSSGNPFVAPVVALKNVIAEAFPTTSKVPSIQELTTVASTGAIVGINTSGYTSVKDLSAWQAYRSAGGKLSPDQWAWSGRPGDTVTETKLIAAGVGQGDNTKKTELMHNIQDVLNIKITDTQQLATVWNGLSESDKQKVASSYQTESQRLVKALETPLVKASDALNTWVGKEKGALGATKGFLAGAGEAVIGLASLAPTAIAAITAAGPAAAIGTLLTVPVGMMEWALVQVPERIVTDPLGGTARLAGNLLAIPIAKGLIKGGITTARVGASNIRGLVNGDLINPRALKSGDADVFKVPVPKDFLRDLPETKLQEIFDPKNKLSPADQVKAVSDLMEPETRKAFLATIDLAQRLASYKVPETMYKSPEAIFQTIGNLNPATAKALADWARVNNERVTFGGSTADDVQGMNIGAKDFDLNIKPKSGLTPEQAKLEIQQIFRQTGTAWSDELFDIHEKLQLGAKPYGWEAMMPEPVTIDGIKFISVGEQFLRRASTSVAPGVGESAGLMGPTVEAVPLRAMPGNIDISTHIGRAKDIFRFQIEAQMVIDEMKTAGKTAEASELQGLLDAFSNYQMMTAEGKLIPLSVVEAQAARQAFIELVDELQRTTLDKGIDVSMIDSGTGGTLTRYVSPAGKVVKGTVYTAVRDMTPYARAAQKLGYFDAGKIMDEAGNIVEAPRPEVFTSPDAAFMRMREIETGELPSNAGIIAIRTTPGDLGRVVNPAFRTEYFDGKPYVLDELTFTGRAGVTKPNAMGLSARAISGGKTAETLTYDPISKRQVPVMWFATEDALAKGLGAPSASMARIMNLMALKATLGDLAHPHLATKIQFEWSPKSKMESQLISFWRDTYKWKGKTSEEIAKAVNEETAAITKEAVEKVNKETPGLDSEAFDKAVDAEVGKIVEQRIKEVTDTAEFNKLMAETATPEYTKSYTVNLSNLFKGVALSQLAGIYELPTYGQQLTGRIVATPIGLRSSVVQLPFGTTVDKVTAAAKAVLATNRGIVPTEIIAEPTTEVTAIPKVTTEITEVIPVTEEIPTTVVVPTTEVTLTAKVTPTTETFRPTSEVAPTRVTPTPTTKDVTETRPTTVVPTVVTTPPTTGTTTSPVTGTTPTTAVPPPTEPPPPERPTPKPPVTVPLPDLSGAKAAKRRRYSDGTVAWKQGYVWKIIPPPYDVKKPITNKYAPIGAQILKGTPQETLVFIGGVAPFADVSFDLGVTDGYIDVARKLIIFTGEGLKTEAGERVLGATTGLSIVATPAARQRALESEQREALGLVQPRKVVRRTIGISTKESIPRVVGG